MLAMDQEILERAAALVPELRARRAETETLRRLPDASVQDLRDLGIFELTAPKELGGTDEGVDALFEVVMALGRGCGSTAWCGGNWAIHNVLMSMFPVEAQQEAFAGGRMPLVSTGFSPLRGSTTPADGGAVISGQWDFASGVHHAEWVVVMAIGEQGPLAHLVPREDLEVLDTWNTGGLRGTGSADVAAQDLLVPAHRLLAMAGPAGEGHSIARELYPSPYLKVPMASVFSAGVLGAILGMAKGALEVFAEATTAKIGGLSGVQVGTRGEVHHRLGESAADIDAAILVGRNMFAEIRRFGEQEREPTMDDRLRWRRDAAWSGHTAAEAVARLFEVGGAHTLWMDDQLHQFHRDITAGSHHYGMARSSLYAGYGRHALGLEAGVAMV